MTLIKKNFIEWTEYLEIKFFSTSMRKLEVRDLHIRKLTAKEFIRILRTSGFTYNNRNTFNKKLIAFAKKHDIKSEHITKLLELKKDDYVKFKVDNKVQIGRFQGEINNGKDLLEIEINGNGALKFLYVDKNKIHFPTRKEISRVKKKEVEGKSRNGFMPVYENFSTPFNSYYD